MDLGESHVEIFAATAHVEARFSCHFHILFTSRTLQNSHLEAFCLWKYTGLRESDWYWRSSTLASRFRSKKSLSNQNLP